MNRRKIVDIIIEDVNAIEVMTECLNQFQRLDFERSSEDQRQKFKMAVRRFACLIKDQPNPKKF